MWSLQSDHSAQAGVRKMEVFPHANQSFWETYRRSLSLLKLITRNLLSRCFVPCLGLQFVCVMWVRKSAPLFYFSQQKLHGKYNMGLADFSSISCMSGISRMISFCSGWRENYRWAWKQREERSDWQSGFSLRWTAERNLISVYTNHCPSIKRTRVGRSEGEEQNKFKSALHFCIKWLWQSTYSLGKLVLLHQWFLYPLSCK